jgi:integrase
VLSTVHKTGEGFRTSVSARVAGAARRLRARRRLSLVALRRNVYRACKAAQIARWAPGQLRHTVATWAAQRASLAATAAFLGHRDGRTTRRFYVLNYTPEKVPTPR